MKDYSWIRDVEKYILAVWMKTGMTASMAKNKRSENINDWSIYEDYYDKYQTCWIAVASKRIAKSMSFQLNKTIEKLGYKDYFGQIMEQQMKIMEMLQLL